MKTYWKCAALMSVLSLTAGCEQSPPPAAPTAPATIEAHGHTHGGHGAGPHEGTLADWGGGKFHVEFTVDHPSQEATVYILGDDEKTPAPIKANEIQLSILEPAFQVVLVAVPQTGDPEGSASKFVGKNEKLGVVQEFAGTITGEVDGTPYAGDFKEEPHGAHEHK